MVCPRVSLCVRRAGAPSPRGPFTGFVVGAKDDQSIGLRVRGICSFGVQRFIFANTGSVKTQFGSVVGRKDSFEARLERVT